MEQKARADAEWIARRIQAYVGYPEERADAEFLASYVLSLPEARAGEVAKVFKTTVVGVGPWCVEFSDGEIVTCRTEERAKVIATLSVPVGGREAALEEAERAVQEAVAAFCRSDGFVMMGPAGVGMAAVRAIRELRSHPSPGGGGGG